MHSIKAEAVKYLIKQGKESKSSTLFIWLLLMTPVLYRDLASLVVWVNAAIFLGYDLLSFRFRVVSDEYLETHTRQSIRVYTAIACTYAVHWGCISGYVFLKPEFSNIHIATALLLAFSAQGGFSLWLISKTAGQLYLCSLFIPSVCIFIYQGDISSYVAALFFIFSLFSILKVGDARAKVFLGMLAEKMASFNDAKNYKTISNEDQLTGVGNRRFFDLNFESLVSEAEENGKPISILVVDIDHFKMVNDTYGHDAGDECIKSVAQLLKNETRESDILSRFGGEEFVIVLPGTSGIAVKAIADRMMSSARENSVRYAGEDITFTISIGVASINSGVYDHKDLFLRADEALYRAKNLGRNCIVYSEPV